MGIAQDIMALSKHQLLGLAGTTLAIALLASPLNASHPGILPIAQVAPAEPFVQLNLLQAVILGAVQGLTEFLPISSQAHLKVVPVILGWGDPGVAFTAVIQLGSIAAVLWYFWRDLAQITLGAFTAITRSDYQAKDLRIALGIALGTLPIVFFGLLIKVFIPDFDRSPLRSLAAIALASIGMS
ncbi:MAG TPA: undecaprenyl-diphosphate phosphatase, partial [Candidatus Caenarcaniphilales bacterium]